MTVTAHPRSFGAFAALAFGVFAGCSSDTTTHSSSSPDAGKATSDASAPPSDGGADIPTTQVTANGFTFDVRIAGPEDGEAVVLLHGFPETSYEWRHQIPALAAKGYHVIAPDQRGYSPGARPSAVTDYGVLYLAQDVTAIADALGVKRFHLVGHDWGGGVAWAVGKLFSDRVLTLTSLSTPHPDALQHELSDKSSCQYQDSAYFDTFTQPDAANTFLANDDALLKGAYAEFSAADQAVYLAALGNLPAMTAALDWYQANIKDRQFALPTLGDVTVPTLLVWGDKDAYFCRDTVELSSQFVTAPYQLSILAGVDHWVPENDPGEVNRLLLEHFANAYVTRE